MLNEAWRRSTVYKVGIQSKVDKRRNELNSEWHRESLGELSVLLQKQANCEIWSRVHLRRQWIWSITVLHPLNEFRK